MKNFTLKVEIGKTHLPCFMSDTEIMYRGALTLHTQAVLFPDRVLGHHTNMFSTPSSLISKIFLVHSFPSFFTTSEDRHLIKTSFFEFVKAVILENGYLHEQSTKPDTVGVAMDTSPLGLAAWILEKVTWCTDREHRFLDDGGLLSKSPFTKDELLGDVTLYWVTQTATSSFRLMKENFKHSNSNYNAIDNFPITDVPVGFAVFPNEIYTPVRYLAEK